MDRLTSMDVPVKIVARYCAPARKSELVPGGFPDQLAEPRPPPEPARPGSAWAGSRPANQRSRPWDARRGQARPGQARPGRSHPMPTVPGGTWPAGPARGSATVSRPGNEHMPDDPGRDRPGQRRDYVDGVGQPAAPPGAPSSCSPLRPSRPDQPGRLAAHWAARPASWAKPGEPPRGTTRRAPRPTPIAASKLPAAAAGQDPELPAQAPRRARPPGPPGQQQPAAEHPPARCRRARARAAHDDGPETGAARLTAPPPRGRRAPLRSSTLLRSGSSHPGPRASKHPAARPGGCRYAAPASSRRPWPCSRHARTAHTGGCPRRTRSCAWRSRRRPLWRSARHPAATRPVRGAARAGNSRVGSARRSRVGGGSRRGRAASRAPSLAGRPAPRRPGRQPGPRTPPESGTVAAEKHARRGDDQPRSVPGTLMAAVTPSASTHPRRALWTPSDDGTPVPQGHPQRRGTARAQGCQRSRTPAAGPKTCYSRPTPTLPYDGGHARSWFLVAIRGRVAARRGGVCGHARGPAVRLPGRRVRLRLRRPRTRPHDLPWSRVNPGGYRYRIVSLAVQPAGELPPCPPPPAPAPTRPGRPPRGRTGSTASPRPLQAGRRPRLQEPGPRQVTRARPRPFPIRGCSSGSEQMLLERLQLSLGRRQRKEEAPGHPSPRALAAGAQPAGGTTPPVSSYPPAPGPRPRRTPARPGRALQRRRSGPVGRDRRARHNR